MNEKDKLKWIIYRVTVPSCCMNCQSMKKGFCVKNRHLSFKLLRHCARRQRLDIFKYGCSCSSWR